MAFTIIGQVLLIIYLTIEQLVNRLLSEDETRNSTSSPDKMKNRLARGWHPSSYYGKPTVR